MKRYYLILLGVACWIIPSHALTYSAWIATTGLTGDTALTSADPDGDGIPNQIEYALAGCDPVATHDTSHLPRMGWMRRTGIAMGAWEWAGYAMGSGQVGPPTSGMGGVCHAALRWTPRSGITDLRYVPQFTHDLNAWFDGNGTMRLQTIDGDTVAVSRAQANQWLHCNNRWRKGFLRLKIVPL